MLNRHSDSQHYPLLYKYEYMNIALHRFFAHSWQYRDRRKPEAESMPYSYFE